MSLFLMSFFSLEKSKGWLSRWFTPKNSAHLPDDKEPSIVWDEEKKKWVDKNAPEVCF